ncbi:hypothetical protein EYR38_007523 [Pleurotus pulmonarius]|nr:hypothetical protein EYR38_007523 [Pleurotus pulmonarius]
MFDHNDFLYPQPQAGWQANANTIRTDVDPVYCDEGATVGGPPWPPAHTYPSFQQSGDFGSYQNSAWAPSPPVASQNLGQYPIQQPPNQFLLIESNSPPIAPTTPTLIPRAVGTPAISTASGNRQQLHSEAQPRMPILLLSLPADHLRAHMNDKPFPCDVCPETAFTAKSDLARHVKKSKRHAAQLRAKASGWGDPTAV